MVREETKYPFDYTLKFTIKTSQNKVALKVRIPAGMRIMSASESYVEEDGFIVIDKKWNGEENVQITFMPEVVIHKDINDESYFSFGPIVLALPIKAIETRTKSYPVKGFYDLKHYNSSRCISTLVSL